MKNWRAANKTMSTTSRKQRDPRDVAPSLANHNRSSVDDAIKFMSAQDSGFCARTSRQHNQFRQKLLGWSKHVESWLDQPDIPVHLIRFEVMKFDTANALRGALVFAGQPTSDDAITRAWNFPHRGCHPGTNPAGPARSVALGRFAGAWIGLAA